MFNKDDIKELLRKGASIESIGNDFATVLNAANKEYQEEYNLNLKYLQKTQELTTICADIMRWVNVYYPSLANTINPKHTGADRIADVIMNNIDEIDEYIDIFKGAVKTFDDNTSKYQKEEDKWAELVQSFLGGN